MTALTAAQAALCLAIFGAGVGTGVVAPAVKKQVSAKATAKPKGERVRTASRPRVVSPEPARPAPRIIDCPVIGSPYGLEPPAIALPMIPPPVLGSGTPVATPGVWGVWPAPTPAPPNFPGAVPEPGAWMLWIGGFGLVGMSVRRRCNGEA
jgi:hypothetical protein